MQLRDRAEPVSPRWRQLAVDEGMERQYHQAAHVLTLNDVEDWLAPQPPHRIITQPRSVLSCLLAVYLTERTSQLWAVTAEELFLFARGDGWAWSLPTWAMTCQRVELQWDRPLTTVDAVTLLRFLDTHATAADWQIDVWLRGRRAA